MALPLNLELKRSGLDPKKRPLEITAERLSYDGKSMACADIDQVKYGTLLLQSSVGTAISDIHELQFRDRHGNQLRITFSASFGKANRERVSDTFESISHALDEAVTNRLVAQMKDALAKGTPVSVGRAHIEGGVAHLKQGLIFKKVVDVPLNELSAAIYQGALSLGRGAGGKPLVQIPLLSVWNAQVLARALGAY